MRYLSLLIGLLIIFCSWRVNAAANNNSQFIPHAQWSRYSKSYDYRENYKTKALSKSKNGIYKPRTISAPIFFSGMSWFVYVLFGLVVAVLIGLIVMIILGLLKQSAEILPKTSIYKPTAYVNIENADLESDLQQALSLGLFKEAIRIQYLILIRTLNKHRMVVWKLDKTNGNYLREMYGKKGFDIFRKITLYFDQVWYGDWEITETDYQNMIPVFEKINLIVSASE